MCVAKFDRPARKIDFPQNRHSTDFNALSKKRIQSTEMNSVQILKT